MRRRRSPTGWYKRPDHPDKEKCSSEGKALKRQGNTSLILCFEDSVQQPRIFQLFGYGATGVLSPTKVLIKTNLSIAEQTSSYFHSLMQRAIPKEGFSDGQDGYQGFVNESPSQEGSGP